MYRSSAAVLKNALALLDQYYYDWMQYRYSSEKEATDKEVDLLCKIVEDIAGVMAMRPAMEPYIETQKWRHVLQSAQQKIDRLVEKRLDEAAEAGPPWFAKERVGNVEYELKKRGVLERIDSNQTTGSFRADEVPAIRELLFHVGLCNYEADNLIQWKIRAISAEEDQLLREVIRDSLNVHLNKRRYGQDYAAPSFAKYTAWKAVASVNYIQDDKVTDMQGLIDKYNEVIFERAMFQTDRLLQFAAFACRIGGFLLQKEPVQIPSQRYKEVEYSRRTYADVRDELAQRLVSLPRFEAIAALVSEKETKHIKTIPLPTIIPSAQSGANNIDL